MIKFINSLICVLSIIGLTNTKPNKIYHGSREKNEIYLTFDDGYSYKNTCLILDTLKRHNVPAAFFLEGGFLDNHPSIVNRMIDDGHIVACHTWTHRDITSLSNDQFIRELNQYRKRYKEITNQEMPLYFRPPMGFIDEKKERILSYRGYKIFLWDVNYVDYDRTRDYGTSNAYNSIVPYVQNGSIILMHTMLDSNAKALDKILTDLKKDYVFKSISEL